MIYYKSMPDSHFSWKDALPSTLVGCCFLAQMLYGGFFLDHPRIESIKYLGVVVFLLSGVFGLAPVLLFPKRGGVKKGKSFVHTTQLVDTGIYAVMRHPQYSSFILWALAAMLLFQDWLVVLLGIPMIVLTYYDMMRADQRNIKKFGDPYKQYMKRVPRVNILLGFYRAVRRKSKK